MAAPLSVVTEPLPKSQVRMTIQGPAETVDGRARRTRAAHALAATRPAGGHHTRAAPAPDGRRGRDRRPGPGRRPAGRAREPYAAAGPADGRRAAARAAGRAGRPVRRGAP